MISARIKSFLYLNIFLVGAFVLILQVIFKDLIRTVPGGNKMFRFMQFYAAFLFLFCVCVCVSSNT